VRRGAIISLVAIGAVVGVAVTAVAVLIDWLPESASEQRDRIDFIFWLTTGICVAIFAIVAAARSCSRATTRPRPTRSGSA